MKTRFVKYIEVQYTEQAASFLAWICGRHSPQTCVVSRNGKGMVSRRTCVEAKISRSYLSQLEKGVYHVSIKVVGRLADKLDVEPDEFLKRTTKELAPNRRRRIREPAGGPAGPGRKYASAPPI